MYKKVPIRDYKKFNRIFGVKNFYRYFSPLTGFNIVKFDEEIIQTGDNERMDYKIMDEYGAEALKLIKKLIKI